METSINILSTADGKKKQKSITNINPNATNAELSEVGQMINALTTNTYVETVRIDKQNVLEPSPSGGDKTEPIFIVEDGSYEYNGDGKVYGFAYSANGTLSIAIDREEKVWEISGSAGTVELYASEGDNYAAKSVTYVKEA